jgi:hypothetical protein
MRLRLGLTSLALLFGLVLAVGSCGDDNPPNVTPDKGVPDAPIVADLPPPAPDVQAPDQFVWPDIKSPNDTWPWPKQDYTGAPFGCQQDVDCFGQKCCPTPWGVKLCAPTCDAK